MAEDKKYYATIARTKSYAVVYLPEETPQGIVNWFSRRFEGYLVETVGPKHEVTRRGNRWDAPLCYAEVLATAAHNATRYTTYSEGYLETFGVEADTPEKAAAYRFKLDVAADQVCPCGNGADQHTQDLWLCEACKDRWYGETGQRVIGGWIDNAITTKYVQTMTNRMGTRRIEWEKYGTPEFLAQTKPKEYGTITNPVTGWSYHAGRWTRNR